MAFNNEIEKTKKEIEVLTAKLALLKEMENHKTPCEIAYKDWWGEYPELETDGEFDVTRWHGFRAGYHFAYEEKVAQEPEENEWKSVALRFGEKLSGYLSDGYYELSPASWFRWAVFTYGKGQQIKDVVHESVKWCEENPDKDPLDWVKPQTPEQTSQSLKEAFVEAQKTEKWKEIQKLIDEEDNDKNFKNSLDLIREWGEKNKPPTLYQILWEWWEDIFTVNSNLDAENSIDCLVDIIDKKFIPPSSERNTYDWERCLKIMREKLR